MKKQLQTIINDRTGQRLASVLLVLALIRAPQFCGAQTAYITHQSDSTISVIDVATNTVSATIMVGPSPTGVSVSADGRRVYVVNQGAMPGFKPGTVSVINTASNTVLATIPVGTYPIGVAVIPDGSKVYVANYFNRSVSVINTDADTVSATITVGNNPFGLSVTPDGSKVYVANAADSSVSVINTATNAVFATITVGAEPEGVSVSPDGSKVYITCYNVNEVNVINTSTNTISDTIAIAAGSGSNGISVSPDGSKVYVANWRNNTMSVINTVTNTVSATVQVGSYPFGISVSPDGSKVYVVNNIGNTVSVINTASNVVADIIPIDYEPGSFGNFISTYPVITLCRSNFAIAADTSQPHHYTITDNSFGTPPISYIWNWGDGSSDSIPYPSHTYANAGFYNICLSITDSTGCQSTFCDSSFHAMRTTNTMVYINVVNPLILGTQGVEFKTQEIDIYPNPATNQLTIHTSSFHNEAVMVSVMNVLGQMASPTAPLQKRGEDAVIDVSKLPAGMYFLQLKSESGSVVKKFVKE